MRTAITLIGHCCLCLPWLFTATTSVAAEGPIAHWTFDRLDGQAVSNSAAAAGPGTVHGATPVAGVEGPALAFDGRDDYVALGEVGRFDAVTIAFWMQARDIAKADDWQGLVTSDTWEEGVFHIGVRDGKIDVHLHLGQARRGRLLSRTLRNGTWYHVAVVADCPDRTIRLFLNGQEEDTADIGPALSQIKLLALVAGREFDGKGFSRYFHGAIDDVRIYDRALQDLEIQQLCPGLQPLSARDPRNIRTGFRIPDEGYCDQPYVVVTHDGNWLCTLTTGPGREGAGGQHVVSTTSSDRGRTWTKAVDIEPSGGPAASWVVPLIVPSGRVYAFYTYNGDRVTTLRGKPIRNDTIGWYAYKYTDDNGRSWSPQRYRLPMRVTACDRTNDWHGKVQIFWGIDKPNVVGSDVVFAFTKLGKYMLELGEGWFYRSDNILGETDVSKLRWQLLPQGDHGLRAPEFGSVQEEHNLVPLDDGSLYCVYRTSKGYPCHAYSRDGGRTWTKPEPMTYTPGGRMVKTPRACPMLWRCKNGNFLFWFHNRAGAFGLSLRNPVWISGGVERNGKLHWSQPEVLLFDPDVAKGMSYPDLIEQDGCYWVTETQKKIARVHELDPSLLEGLWTQGRSRSIARQGLLADLGPEQCRPGSEVILSTPLDLDTLTGFSLDCWVRLDRLTPGQAILDGRDAEARGIALVTAENRTVGIRLADAATSFAWDADPGRIEAGKLHHVVVIVDSGPRVVSFVIDGVLCDGGQTRDTGWTRYPAELGDVSGSGKLRIGPSPAGRVEHLRVYRRYLRTSEAVAHFHAGC